MVTEGVFGSIASSVTVAVVWRAMVAPGAPGARVTEVDDAAAGAPGRLRAVTSVSKYRKVTVSPTLSASKRCTSGPQYHLFEESRLVPRVTTRDEWSMASMVNEALTSSVRVAGCWASTVAGPRSKAAITTGPISRIPRTTTLSRFI